MSILEKIALWDCSNMQDARNNAYKKKNDDILVECFNLVYIYPMCTDEEKRDIDCKIDKLLS